MTVFEWKPNEDERVKMVSQLFFEIPEQQCAIIVREIDKAAAQMAMADVQIAFYAHLRTILYDEWLWNALSKHGITRGLENIVDGRQPKVDFHPNLSQILQKGLELLSTSQFINHLRRG
jgi:hypothetical protein